MTEKIPDQIREAQGRFVGLEAFFDTAMHHTQDAILFLSSKGHILLINASAQKLLHLQDTHLIGKRFWDLLPDGYFGFSVRDALLFGFSHRLLYRSYASKELEITTSFVGKAKQGQQGIVILFRDITEKISMQSLKMRGCQMEKLGEMMTTTTHEIKNPLGGIRGYASLLYRDLKEQSHLREMAGRILDGAKSLETLVSNLLHYARPLQLFPSSVEIGPFLRQFIQFIKADPICPKNLRWHIHIPNEPIIAPIDREAFQSVLFNLCINAFQAMPAGGSLTLSLLQIDRCYEITISDTGVGMNDEQISKLFTPHFTTKKHGNGLGLLQVQKIVQAHFGTINIRSHPGQGSSFTLLFPMQRGYQ